MWIDEGDEFQVLSLNLFPTCMTANLRGPVVVNAGARTAKQLILREEYPTRAPVLLEGPALAAPAGQAISLVECHR